MKKKFLFKLITAMMVLLFCFTNGFLLSNFDKSTEDLKTSAAISDFSSTGFSTKFAEDVNFTNLIVFARFSDEDEFVNKTYDDVSVKQLIDNTYSNCEYNISDYFYSVSNGNVRMQNLYLYQNNGSLQLSRPRGYYAEKDETLNPEGYEPGEETLRRLDLIDDWTTAINNAFQSGSMPSSLDGTTTYSISDLDKNNDGKIDSITIIYKNTEQNISVSWSSPLWNYKYYTYAVTVQENGKTYTSSEYTQLTFTYESTTKTLNYIDSNGVRFLSSSAAMHETSHIFGLLDLYRPDTSSQIYFMSLMGKPISPVGQFVSNKEREAMGWIGDSQVVTLSAEGTYKLNVTSSEISSNKVLAYKLPLPKLNKILYLEYRNFKGTQNIFDSQTKTIYMSNGEALRQINLKSGLICYLVNADMKIPSNIGTSGSNWNYLALGGTQSTKSDCAVGANERLDITGTLYVEVNSISDNELEFGIYGDELKNDPHIHDLTHYQRVEPTCTKTGNIEYYYCSSCQKYFSDELATNEIDASNIILQKTGHTKQILPAKEATCTETGLTVGEKCSVCNEILVQQTIIPKINHSESDWIIDSLPTTEQTGHKHKECTVCHLILEEQEINKLPIKDNSNENDNNENNNNQDGNQGDNSNNPNNTPNDSNNAPKKQKNKTITIVIIVTSSIVVTAGATTCTMFIFKKKHKLKP